MKKFSLYIISVMLILCTACSKPDKVTTNVGEFYQETEVSNNDSKETEGTQATERETGNHDNKGNDSEIIHATNEELSEEITNAATVEDILKETDLNIKEIDSNEETTLPSSATTEETTIPSFVITEETTISSSEIIEETTTTFVEEASKDAVNNDTQVEILPEPQEGNLQDGKQAGKQDGSIQSGTPYDIHGKLSVNGTNMVDCNGNAFQLKGISTHGLQWFGQYVNYDTFKTLRDTWGINAMRLAMYTGEGGYCQRDEAGRNELLNIIDAGVKACDDLGLYVIIDWHILSDSNPMTYADMAAEFFYMITEKYKDYDNIIYEICNEPNGGTSWDTIKSYAERIIPIIRANSPDAIIVVGTPTWSQDVDIAAQNPITGYDNIMYTLHFYADTHRDSLRDKLTNARNAGLPIMVTEFGICDASGNGAINVGEADKWIALLDSYGISYFSWNLSNKNESSSLISSGCSKLSGFSDSELSDSGRWYKGVVASENNIDYSNGSKEESNQYVENETQQKDGNSSNDSSNVADNNPNAGNDSSIVDNSSGAGNHSNIVDNSSHGGSNNSNVQQENVQSNGNNESITGSTASESGGLVPSATKMNSWSSNGMYYAQFSISITNNTQSMVEGWRLEVKFDKAVSVSQYWNCNNTSENNVIILTPADYNGNINQGSTCGDIGLILCSNEEFNVESIECK